MPLTLFNEWFGWHTRAYCKLSNSFNEVAYWRELTRNPIVVFISGSAKSTQILNPYLRCIHRLLVTTMFGHVDTQGSMIQRELHIIWTIDKQQNVNFSY